MTGAGWDTIRFATFAVSMLEPPPTDTKPSTPRVEREVGRLLEASRASARPARGRRPRPRCPRPRCVARTRSGWPSRRRPGRSPAARASTPRRLSSQPASAAAPGPNLIGVASSVKIVSWSKTKPLHGQKARASVPPVTDPLGACARGLRRRSPTSSRTTTCARRYEVDWTGRYGGRARVVVRPPDPREVAAWSRPAPSRRGDRAAGRQHRAGRRGVPRGGEVVLARAAARSARSTPRPPR